MKILKVSFFVRQLPLAFIFSIVFIGLFSQSSAAYEFPRVRGLESRVAFWKKVYAVWSIDQIALHDDQDFSMIYQVIKVPKRGRTLKGKTRKQTIRTAKSNLIKALGVLAHQNPTSAVNLSGLEKELFLKLQKVKRKDKYNRINHIRAQNGLRERFRHGWINAGGFEPEVRRQLKAAGHPEELVALAYVESLMSLRVKSYAGAQGIWQFMPATGREYMHINDVLDERHDPIIATAAAAKYINTALRKVGPWPVAITSYNYGRAGVRRLIKKAGSNDLAVVLKISRAKRFGFAARNYYASFLAVTEILQSPTSFFKGAQQVAEWQYDVVRLPFSVKASVLVKKGALSAADLKRINPGIRLKARQGKYALPKGLPLRVPRGKSALFLAKLKGSKVYERALRGPQRYRVRRGDSLFAVAKKFKITRTALAQANAISKNAGLQRGQRLLIPGQKAGYSLFPDAANLAVPNVAHQTFLAEAEAPQKTAPIAQKKRNIANVQTVNRVKVTLVSVVSWEPELVLPPIDSLVGAQPLPSIDVLGAAGGHFSAEPLNAETRPPVLPQPALENNEPLPTS